jgi:hypothetical protein
MVRVLFVSADPVGEVGVEWSDVAAEIDRAMVAQMPAEVSIKVERATRKDLIDAIARVSFDVYHFFGHGDLKNNVGHLVLQDIKTGKSDFISATDLAVALAGKGVQLAFLETVGLEIARTPLVGRGIVLENGLGVAPHFRQFVGDVAEIEAPENAVELRHVDVGDTGVPAYKQHVLVVLQ